MVNITIMAGYPLHLVSSDQLRFASCVKLITEKARIYITYVKDRKSEKLKATSGVNALRKSRVE